MGNTVEYGNFSCSVGDNLAAFKFEVNPFMNSWP